jgi:hypothetical protein
LPSSLDPRNEGPPEIEASIEVARFVNERGGCLYIWADDSGLEHAHTEPPDQPVEFMRIPASGFTVYQDATIASPPMWKLIYRHIQPHIEARWGNVTVDAGDGSGSTG